MIAKCCAVLLLGGDSMGGLTHSRSMWGFADGVARVQPFFIRPDGVGGRRPTGLERLGVRTGLRGYFP